MKLTRQNFPTEFGNLLPKMRSCTFMSIKCEFTGIYMEDYVDFIAKGNLQTAIANLLQLPEEKYKEARKAISGYEIMQIGVSLFTLDCSYEISPPSLALATRRKKISSLFKQFKSSDVFPISTQNVINGFLKDTKSFVYIGKSESTQLTEHRDRTTAAIKALSEEMREMNTAEYVGAFQALEVLGMVAEACNTVITMFSKGKKNQLPLHEYFAQSFSAYMFPAKGTTAGDANFMVSAESLSFLHKHGMNFNKWVSEGLPVAPMKEVGNRRVQKLCWVPINESGVQDMDELPVSVAAYYAKDCILSALLPLSAAEVDYLLFAFNTYSTTESRKAMMSEKVFSMHCGSCKVLVQNAPVVIRFSREGGGDCQTPYLFHELRDQETAFLKALGLRKGNGRYTQIEAVQSIDGETPNTMEPVVHRDDSGSLLLLAILAAAKSKTVVVHNGFMDIMFIMKTILGELPSTLDEFKRELHSLLPTVYDTRLVSYHPVIQNPECLTGALATTYRKLLTKYGKHISVQVEGDDPRVLFGEHDTDYDSFITGHLYLMLKYAITQNYGDSVERYMNKVPLHGSIFCIALDDPAHDVAATEDGVPILFMLTSNRSMRPKVIHDILSEEGIFVTTMCTCGGYVIYADTRALGYSTERLKSILSSREDGTPRENVQLEVVDYQHFVDEGKIVHMR